MLFLTRHMLNQHLMELPALIDRYAARDAGFVDDSLSWMTSVERTLLRLRHPLTGMVAACRSEVLAARDGYRQRETDSMSTSSRQAQRATAAIVVSRIEKTLQSVVVDIDTQLDGLRDKMAQLLALASSIKPIPASNGRPRDDCLRSLWADMGMMKETAGMYAYLNAAIPRDDVITLLGDVLENFLAAAEGHVSRSAIS